MDGGSNGLGKLFPKSITAKRRRRKEKRGRDSEASGQEDDARSFVSVASSQRTFEHHDMDDRTVGSYESGLDRGQGLGQTDQFTDQFTDQYVSSASSTSPRPVAISAHPSLIGYLTTSSPAIQAQHLDAQSDFQSSTGTLGSAGDGSDQSTLRKQSSKAQAFLGLQKQTPDPFAPVKIAPADRTSRASPPKLQALSLKTPPIDENSAIVIVSTPPTPTDPSDKLQPESAPDGTPSPTGSSPRAGADGIQGAASNMNIHRRSKSGSAVVGPSKLSHTTTAPLTPTNETGGVTTPSAPGFFSSMLSAAQNAASSISNTIPSPGLGIGGGNKNRVGASRSQSTLASTQSAPVDEPDMEPDLLIDDAMDRRESAIRTLGSGDLSLGHLGLAEPSAPSPVAARFPDVWDTRSRSESAPADPQTTNGDNALPTGTSSRPRSLVETASGDQTPPLMEFPTVKSPIQRSSSLRSAMRRHRRRDSSVTTSGTVAAAVASANSAALQPTSNAAAPKLTGFAIASKKRNRDFHSLFKSVPDDDYLIEDYSCALQREILAHGRLYVSEGHLCFSSNILGWTTTLVMSFDEIVSVEKRSTALVFKNGLMISTLHAKHIFASFTSRDATYDLIVNIWKLGHPTLRSTLNGVQLEGTGGDKTEKVVSEQDAEAVEAQEEASGSDQSSDDDGDEDGGGRGGAGNAGDDDDDEEFYDEEEHGEQLDRRSTEIRAAEADGDKSVPRKTSTMTAIHLPTGDSLPKDAASPPGASVVDFPGPAAHAATDCGDSATHYDKILADDVVPAPLGKVYNLVFGPGSLVWMNRWLASDQKCTEIEMEDKKGLTGDNKTRFFTYIKPLNGSIGPKQTKCFVTESLDRIELEKAVNVSVSTQTPEVPYGNLFTTKTKYCLSWAENNSTRMQINCTVEWSGKCWLKGTIERNVNEGQGQYCKELFASLRSAVSTRARSGMGPAGNPKGKKKLKRSKALQLVHDMGNESSSKSDARKQSWGPLEPLRGVLEPVVDVLRPVLTANVMYGLLVGLIVAMWFGFGTTPKLTSSYGPDMGYGYYGPGRGAGYHEEMWRRQDAELWEWLEERVGMDRLNGGGDDARKRGGVEPRTVEEKLREEGMDEREVREAIRVTEEKLRVLKEVVARRNAR